jgi:hypothetical protein
MTLDEIFAMTLDQICQNPLFWWEIAATAPGPYCVAAGAAACGGEYRVAAGEIS